MCLKVFHCQIDSDRIFVKQNFHLEKEVDHLYTITSCLWQLLFRFVIYI